MPFLKPKASGGSTPTPALCVNLNALTLPDSQIIDLTVNGSWYEKYIGVTDEVFTLTGGSPGSCVKVCFQSSGGAAIIQDELGLAVPVKGCPLNFGVDPIEPIPMPQWAYLLEICCTKPGEYIVESCCKIPPTGLYQLSVGTVAGTPHLDGCVYYFDRATSASIEIKSVPELSYVPIWYSPDEKRIFDGSRQEISIIDGRVIIEPRMGNSTPYWTRLDNLTGSPRHSYGPGTLGFGPGGAASNVSLYVDEVPKPLDRGLHFGTPADTGAERIVFKDGGSRWSQHSATSLTGTLTEVYSVLRKSAPDRFSQNFGGAPGPGQAYTWTNGMHVWSVGLGKHFDLDTTLSQEWVRQCGNDNNGSDPDGGWGSTNSRGQYNVETTDGLQRSWLETMHQSESSPSIAVTPSSLHPNVEAVENGINVQRHEDYYCCDGVPGFFDMPWRAKVRSAYKTDKAMRAITGDDLPALFDELFEPIISFTPFGPGGAFDGVCYYHERGVGSFLQVRSFTSGVLLSVPITRDNDHQITVVDVNPLTGQVSLEGHSTGDGVYTAAAPFDWAGVETCIGGVVDNTVYRLQGAIWPFMPNPGTI